MDSAPIFVHSLFRAGSTYVFNAFRRSKARYWCYQEPLHEFIRHVTKAPERLLDPHFELETTLRHPHIEKPYFWELYELRAVLAPLFRKELSYDSFFMREGHASFNAVARYLECLLDNARRRPMLQCCRTFGRVAALRKLFAGKHIHLWRNPRDQWWSYQVNEYFDVTTQLILNAIDPPRVLLSVKEKCGITDFHDPNIENEIAHAGDRPLSAHDSFFAFYAQWLYSLIETEKAVDMSLNIDTLSLSEEYRRRALDSFVDVGISEIDFSDCRITQAAFGRRDIDFFDKMENQVHELFVANGYKVDDIDAAMKLRADHKPAHRQSIKGLIGDAARSREVALKKIDRLAQSQRVVENQRVALECNRLFTETIEGDRAALAEALDRANQKVHETLIHLTQATEERSALQIRLTTLSQELAATIAQSDLQLSAVISLRQTVSTSHAYAKKLEDELSRTRSRIDDLRLKMTNEFSQARSKIDELHLEMTKWHGVANDINRHLQAVYATRSWRLTAPLRYIQERIRRLDFSTNAAFSGLINLWKRIVVRLLAGTARYVQGRPEIKRILIKLFGRFPRRYQQLRSIAFSYAARPPEVSTAFDRPPISHRIDKMDDIALAREGMLAPSALRVYRRLADARKATANRSI